MIGQVRVVSCPVVNYSWVNFWVEQRNLLVILAEIQFDVR
jgi:hypothetical protein